MYNPYSDATCCDFDYPEMKINLKASRNIIAITNNRLPEGVHNTTITTTSEIEQLSQHVRNLDGTLFHSNLSVENCFNVESHSVDYVISRLSVH